MACPLLKLLCYKATNNDILLLVIILQWPLFYFYDISDVYNVNETQYPK